MKNLRSFILIICLLGAGSFMVGCANSGGEQATEVAHGEGKEYNSDYVCPMHCEGSGSDEMGTCPVCGMDYVAQADHGKDGHSH